MIRYIRVLIDISFQLSPEAPNWSDFLKRIVMSTFRDTRNLMPMFSDLYMKNCRLGYDFWKDNTIYGK